MAYPPSTTYRATSLTEAQYNADISNLANAMIPGNIDDASSTVGDMQTTTNPGGLGSESLATTLTGELERIRYMIKLITGQAQWYIDPGLSLGASQFAAGTAMVFRQTSAPATWTKVTDADYNDCAFRCITGSINTASSTNPSRSAFLATVMAQTVVGSHTLTTAEIPPHTHTVGFAENDAPATAARNGSGGTSGTFNSGSAGGGVAHNHTVSMNIKYIDLIVATKN